MFLIMKYDEKRFELIPLKTNFMKFLHKYLVLFRIMSLIYLSIYTNRSVFAGDIFAGIFQMLYK